MCSAFVLLTNAQKSIRVQIFWMIIIIRGCICNCNNGGGGVIFLYFDHECIRQKAKKKIIYLDFCRHNTTISTYNYDKWCMFYAKIYDLIFIYNQPTAFISGCSTLLDWHYWHGHYPSTSYHYFNTSIFFKKFNLYRLKCLSNEHLFFPFHFMECSLCIVYS